MLIFSFLIAAPVFANKNGDHILSGILGSELLKAAEQDNTMSKEEKLFKHRCAVIEKYLTLTNTPTHKAVAHSCSGAVVGVSFYVGDDLGIHSPEKIAAHIRNMFAKHGVSAKVFFKDNKPYASRVAFIMKGGSFLYEPTDPVSAINSIESFAAEMKLLLFRDKDITSEQLKVWVKATEAHIPKTS